MKKEKFCKIINICLIICAMANIICYCVDPKVSYIEGLLSHINVLFLIIAIISIETQYYKYKNSILTLAEKGRNLPCGGFCTYPHCSDEVTIKGETCMDRALNDIKTKSN